MSRPILWRSFGASLLAASALGLGAALATEKLELAEPDHAAPAESASIDEALNPLAALEKGSLNGFRDLPLFTPSRRRPEPPPVIEAEAPPPPAPVVRPPAPPPELKLAGVVLGPEGAVAIVQAVGETRAERLRLGDQKDGWLVTGIEADSLKLTLEDREQKYRLFDRSASKTPSAADASDDSGMMDEDVVQRPRGKDRPRANGRPGGNGQSGGNENGQHGN